MKRWIIFTGSLLVVIPTIIFLTLAFDPFVYCYGGGAQYVTTTLSNGTTLTHYVIASPICGGSLNLLIAIFAALAAGIFLIAFGVRRGKPQRTDH